jgi:hypothetical protein
MPIGTLRRDCLDPAVRILNDLQDVARARAAKTGCLVQLPRSGAPSGERNGQYRHGERTKAAIAERQKFSALLKLLRAALA